jgi:hypothetical protein
LEVPDFKNDEVAWERKKSSQTVHEQYLKLLIKGVHVITGQYATSSTNPVSQPSSLSCSPDTF